MDTIGPHCAFKTFPLKFNLKHVQSVAIILFQIHSSIEILLFFIFMPFLLQATFPVAFPSLFLSFVWRKDFSVRPSATAGRISSATCFSSDSSTQRSTDHGQRSNRHSLPNIWDTETWIVHLRLFWDAASVPFYLCDLPPSGRPDGEILMSRPQPRNTAYPHSFFLEIDNNV